MIASTLSRIASPTVLLYAFVVISGAADAFYFGRQLEPPPLFSLVRWIALLWVMGWWLQTDSRKRAVASVYDMGFFLYIAWPVVMPYYLVKTRGAKGLLFVLAFIGALIGGVILGFVFAAVLP
jgi:hypothetical protein